jgi:hypothetical protein
MPNTTIDLVISAVNDAELQSYVPSPQYSVLRDLLGTVPPSNPAEQGERAKLVVIRIEFCNSSEEPIEVEFDNTTCKAELLNLEVRDDLGAALDPIRRLHARPKALAPVPRVVPARGKHVYDLVGEVVEGWLVFPGAKYRIPQNGNLHVQFKYNGAISNTLGLHLRS